MNTDTSMFVEHDMGAAEARHKAGHKTGDWRKRSLEADDAEDVMTQIHRSANDFYLSRTLERRRGQFIPTRIPKWDDVMTHFLKFLEERVPTNIKRLRSQRTDGLRVAMVPFFYDTPHPTTEQTDAIHAKMEALLTPMLAGRGEWYATAIHGTQPGEMVMMMVVLFLKPRGMT